MCTNPINIINSTKVLYKNLFQPYILTVPCGQCPDCSNSKRLEWRLRLYYEFRRCFDDGGFVLFDTLTYSEDYVPWFKDALTCDGLASYLNYDFDDFRIFYYRDVTLFLKRFRKVLKKELLSFGVKDFQMKYFYCGEYGQSDGSTFRPHYHILFFFNGFTYSSNIACKISDLINSCWSLGRTDNYNNTDYPSLSSWLEHAVLLPSSCDNVRLQKVSSYVSKYVTKSFSFDKVSSKHFNVLRNSLFNDASISSSEAQKLYNSFKRSVSPRFFSSHNFGCYALRLFDLHYIYKNHSLPLPDKDKVKINVPLSIFFKRKLFFYVHISDDGTRQWRYNEDGLLYLWDNLIKRFNQTLSSLRSKLSLDDALNSEVNRLLAGRDISYFVFYKVCYKGRIINFDSFREFNGLFPVEFVNQLDYIRCTFPVSRTYFENLISRDKSVPSSVVVDGNPISVPDFCRLYVYHSDFIPDWKDFDLIDNLINKYYSLKKHSDSVNVSDVLENLCLTFKSNYYV